VPLRPAPHFAPEFSDKQAVSIRALFDHAFQCYSFVAAPASTYAGPASCVSTFDPATVPGQLPPGSDELIDQLVYLAEVLGHRSQMA
jgi:hypothetical protein